MSISEPVTALKKYYPLRRKEAKMNVVIAFAIINIKLLLKDKLAFAWAIFLPSFMLWFNFKKEMPFNTICFWWVYIILSAYIFGVGIGALYMRESGTLRIVFSICRKPLLFFYGLVCTQLLFCLISLSIFNVFAAVLTEENFFLMEFRSLLILILCIPIAFLGYNLTLIKKVHANSVHTISSIILLITLFLAGSQSKINMFNPIVMVVKLLEMGGWQDYVRYLVISSCCIGISIPSIFSFKCVSSERR